MGAKRPLRELLSLNDKQAIIITDAMVPTSVPLHFHKEYELVFFYNCKGLELTIGTLTEKTSEAELILIAPNIPHGWKFPYTPSKEARILTINFNEQFLAGTYGKKVSYSVFTDGFSGIVFSSKTAYLLIEKLTAIIKQKKKSVKAELRSILKLLGESTDKRTLFGEKESVQPEITALEKYLLANYNNKITLQNACNFTGMSPASFNRYITKHTGVSFIAFLNNIKLTVAAKYLSETDEKVAEIAILSGFTNLANFNRVFKNRYSLTPLKYRALYFGRRKMI